MALAVGSALELPVVLAGAVRARAHGQEAGPPHVDAWIQEHVDSQERERFREAGEVELLSLHEGNFARYQIRPFEFTAWREVWGK